jgi:hypothetical protein
MILSMLTESEAIAAHIAEGFAQAERGELIDAEQVVQILRERRTKRDAGRLPEERGARGLDRALRQLSSHNPLKQ